MLLLKYVPNALPGVVLVPQMFSNVTQPNVMRKQEHLTQPNIIFKMPLLYYAQHAKPVVNQHVLQKTNVNLVLVLVLQDMYTLLQNA